MFKIFSIIIYLNVFITVLLAQCNEPLQCLQHNLCKPNIKDGDTILFPCNGPKNNTVYFCCSTPELNTKFNTDNDADELFPKECGKTLGQRVTNGENATVGQFPWMALLGYQFPGVNVLQFYCGGSLINNRYILTAAHCLQLKGVNLVSVRLGETDLDTELDCFKDKNDELKCINPVIDIPIEKQITHPKYDITVKRSYKHDIGLIRLKDKVIFTDYIKPICLPFNINLTEDSYVNRQFEISGWGKVQDDVFDGSALLQYANVVGWNRTRCNLAVTRQLRPIKSTQFCAVGVDGQDSCKGDSGGPLTNITSDNSLERRRYQIGIVSLGLGSSCGDSETPSIYTRVEKYLKWIKKEVHL